MPVYVHPLSYYYYFLFMADIPRNRSAITASARLTEFTAGYCPDAMLTSASSRQLPLFRSFSLLPSAHTLLFDAFLILLYERKRRTHAHTARKSQVNAFE